MFTSSVPNFVSRFDNYPFPMIWVSPTYSWYPRDHLEAYPASESRLAVPCDESMLHDLFLPLSRSVRIRETPAWRRARVPALLQCGRKRRATKSLFEAQQHGSASQCVRFPAARYSWKKLEGFESHIFAVRTANLAVRTARLAVQPRSSCGPDRNAAANLPAVRSVA